jgi:integrase/recombinase XerD
MLTDTTNTYLSMRRALGFELRDVERYLRSYATFATSRGDRHVVGKTAIEWAALGGSENQRVNRLNVLIRFARFARAECGEHEVPPNRVFGGQQQRRTPYIFTDDEVWRVLVHAGRLGPPGALRPHTYRTLFGLLAVTGLRISEALSLRIPDIGSDGLVIRKTKFRKSRLVSVHATVAKALQQYMDLRRQYAGADDHVFVSRRGGQLGYDIAAKTFQEVLQAAEVHGPPDGPRPRLHDLRHNSGRPVIPSAGLEDAAVSELHIDFACCGSA